MSDIVRQAKSYLKKNAAESGADVLIEEMLKEIERLRLKLGDIRRARRSAHSSAQDKGAA